MKMCAPKMVNVLVLVYNVQCISEYFQKMGGWYPVIVLMYKIINKPLVVVCCIIVIMGKDG